MGPLRVPCWLLQLSWAGLHGLVIGLDFQMQSQRHVWPHLVAWGVEEGDLPRLAKVVDVAGVGADGLRDAARLARRHLGLPDEVQQRGLQSRVPMLNVEC